MNLPGFRRSGLHRVLAAIITGSIAGSASAQTLPFWPLPRGQIVTGPIVRGQTFTSGNPPPNCPKNSTTPCRGTTYPSISNGHDANQYILPAIDYNETTLPFIDSTSAPAAVVWTYVPTQWVRFYTTSALGPWVAPSNQVRGLTPWEVREVLALPQVPTMEEIVVAPAQTCILAGQAGPITNAQNVSPPSAPGYWGRGGAVQDYLIGVSPTGCGPGSSPSYLPPTAYVNQQFIGDYALAYVPRAGYGNPLAVAFALDHASFPAQFTDGDSVYNLLDLLNYGDPRKLRYALTQLDGEIYANAPSIVIGAGRMFLEVLRDQTQLTRLPSTPRSQNGVRPWISGFGGAAYLNGNQNVSGIRFSGGGAAVGIDYAYNPNFQIGVSAAYSRNSFSMNGISASGNLDSYSFGSYAGYALGSFYLDAALGYSYNPAGVGRSIALPYFARAATASFHNDALLSRAEFGYDFFWTAQLKTTPFAAFQSVVVFPINFSEQGAGAISMDVKERTVTTAMSALGTELSYDMPIGLNAPVTLSGRAGWSHDFADVNRFALVNFQGISRSNFWVEGARWPRNAASIGAKISLPLAQAKLFIRYDGMFANNANISSATGGISINF